MNDKVTTVFRTGVVIAAGAAIIIALLLSGQAHPITAAAVLGVYVGVATSIVYFVYFYEPKDW
jgi:uncharacterized membrane protein YgaE (UPF0421/DUF939 family)